MSIPRSAAVSAPDPAAAAGTPRKAVALISGGLDSMLAAKVMLEQGIHVEGINFYTGFCVEGHTHAIRNHEHAKPKRNNALWTAEQLGIKLHIIEVIEEYKDVVINPKHGYGANLNPCLDCKGFMVRKAREWMEKNGFDFIITGEVLGQRPMSQRRDTMPVVARESGAFDRLLRPLCAKLLPETLPEREGWVDRSKLLDFNGRSRKPQMRWRRNTASRITPSRPGAAAFSPTSSTRTSSPTCGPRAAPSNTSSTTSCCSRSAATCARARISS
jgi:tRNA-uridine 2-sulfurtransferase